MTQPFVVFSLPRSRSKWLSRFLSHHPYICSHDQVRYIRGLDDVRSWLSQDRVGSVETAGAAWWRLARYYRPDLRMAVVRRSRREVVDSLMRFGLFDRARLDAAMARCDRALDSAARASGCIEVGYDDLDAGGAARIFQHCVGVPPDATWIAQNRANVQIDFHAAYAYLVAHQPQMARAAKMCANAQRRFTMRPAKIESDENGVVVREEPFPDFWRDGQHAMVEHCLSIGQKPDYALGMNHPTFETMCAAGLGMVVTARLNGRIVGYITACVTPTFERIDDISMVQMSLFVAADARALNVRRKLQAMALDQARRKGANKAYFRCGVVGDGPRLGAVYRRMGAVPYGELYEMTLKEAG